MDNNKNPDRPWQQPPSHAADDAGDSDGRIEHAEVSFEPRDIHFGRLLALLVGVGCVLAVQYYAVWQFYWSREHVQEEVKRSPYPLAPAPSTELPPPPRLDQLDRMTPGQAVADDDQLAAKEKNLNCYGSTAEKGFVQIPIQQAIRAVAGTLPVAKDRPLDRAAGGLLDEGQSNSGRMFRGVAP